MVAQGEKARAHAGHRVQIRQPVEGSRHTLLFSEPGGDQRLAGGPLRGVEFEGQQGTSDRSPPCNEWQPSGDTAFCFEKRPARDERDRQETPRRVSIPGGAEIGLAARLSGLIRLAGNVHPTAGICLIWRWRAARPSRNRIDVLPRIHTSVQNNSRRAYPNR